MFVVESFPYLHAISHLILFFPHSLSLLSCFRFGVFLYFYLSAVVRMFGVDKKALNCREEKEDERGESWVKKRNKRRNAQKIAFEATAGWGQRTQRTKMIFFFYFLPKNFSRCCCCCCAWQQRCAQNLLLVTDFDFSLTATKKKKMLNEMFCSEKVSKCSNWYKTGC